VTVGITIADPVLPGRPSMPAPRLQPAAYDQPLEQQSRCPHRRLDIDAGRILRCRACGGLWDWSDALRAYMARPGGARA